jgi:nucleotide-binding universal stress UspA family protein
MTFSNILVPIAGVSADEAAIRLACQTARQDKARVLLIHVIEVQRHLPLNVENEAQMAHAESVLEHAEQISNTAKFSVETEVLQARLAGPALVDDAVERSVDLIILGVPYSKPLGDFQLGSTVIYVLKNAPCPVWLCREPPRPEIKPGLKTR